MHRCNGRLQVLSLWNMTGDDQITAGVYLIILQFIYLFDVFHIGSVALPGIIVFSCYALQGISGRYLYGDIRNIPYSVRLSRSGNQLCSSEEETYKKYKYNDNTNVNQ